jgi:hypothetical protein
MAFGKTSFTPTLLISASFAQTSDAIVELLMYPHRLSMSGIDFDHPALVPLLCLGHL